MSVNWLTLAINVFDFEIQSATGTFCDQVIASFRAEAGVTGLRMR